MLHRTEYVIPSDGAFGSRNENGTWDGTVGLVATEKAELGIGLFTCIAERMDVVHYLPPILKAQ